MCRNKIEVPQHLLNWTNDNDANAAAMDGLSTSLHVSSPRAQEIFDILHFSVRQLLTAPRPELFMWSAPAMLSDLPRVMITIARRFHYRALGLKVPADLSFLKLHNPKDRLVGTRPAEIKMDLEYLSIVNAQLSNHPDGRALYALLRDRILDLEDFLDDGTGVVADVYVQAEALYLMVMEELPYANGGVRREKWRAYVQCVINALIVWQGYCAHVNRLTMRQVTIDAARAAEGVLALTII